MKRAISAFVAVVLFAVILAGCIAQPRMLVDTDTLQIVTHGAYTTVSDLAGGATYQYMTVRIKRTDAPTEAATATDTATITIVLLPHGGFEIADKTSGKTYTITRNSELFGMNRKRGSE